MVMFTMRKNGGSTMTYKRGPGVLLPYRVSLGGGSDMFYFMICPLKELGSKKKMRKRFQLQLCFVLWNLQNEHTEKHVAFFFLAGADYCKHHEEDMASRLRSQCNSYNGKLNESLSFSSFGIRISLHEWGEIKERSGLLNPLN